MRIPSYITGINWASPQARGLVASYPLFNNSNTIRDYVAGQHLTGTGSLNNVADSTFKKLVPSTFLNNDFTRPNNGRASVIDQTDNFAISFWARSTSFLFALASVTLRIGASNTTLLILYPFDNVLGDGFRVWFNGATLGGVRYAHSLNDGEWHNFIYNRDGADHHIWADNVLLGSPTNSDLLDAETIDIGHWNGIQDCSHPVCAVNIWNRTLTDHDISALYNRETRWDVWRSSEKTIFTGLPSVIPPAVIQANTSFGQVFSPVSRNSRIFMRTHIGDLDTPVTEPPPEPDTSQLVMII